MPGPAGAPPLLLANSTGAGIQAGPLLAAREAAAFNLGPAAARVALDGAAFELAANDTLYIPAKTAEVAFESLDPKEPAKLFLVSAPCGVKTKPVKVRRPAGWPGGRSCAPPGQPSLVIGAAAACRC